jgi:hypothetical protein
MWQTVTRSSSSLPTVTFCWQSEPEAFAAIHHPDVNTIGGSAGRVRAGQSSDTEAKFIEGIASDPGGAASYRHEHPKFKQQPGSLQP